MNEMRVLLQWYTEFVWNKRKKNQTSVPALRWLCKGKKKSTYIDRNHYITPHSSVFLFPPQFIFILWKKISHWSPLLIVLLCKMSLLITTTCKLLVWLVNLIMQLFIISSTNSSFSYVLYDNLNELGFKW